LYPESVLNKNKIILRRFWKGSIRTVWSSYPHEHQYRQIVDTDEMVSEAILNLSCGTGMPGINIPRFTVDFGTISTASFWGGKVTRQQFGNPWIDTVVHFPEDVSTMVHTDPCSGDTQKAADIYYRVAKRMATDSLPCTCFDLQGPLNTLSLIWNQDNMMISMYEYPEKVHEALLKVTNLLILNIECLFKRIPMIEAPLWPYIWLPPDIGLGITEDYMPLLSPELYKAFGLPYVKMLSDKFKGLFIHCCGEFTHQIENLSNADINLLGMEIVYPKIDIEKLFKVFEDRCVFVPNIMDNCIEEFGSYTDYMKYVEGLRRTGTRIWYILRPDLPDFNDQVKLMESFCEV